MALLLTRPYLLAVTLHQPWAWAFRHAGKRLENRDWRPADVLRKLGRVKGQRVELKRGDLVAIHAGKTFDDDGLDCLREMVETQTIEPVEAYPEIADGRLVRPPVVLPAVGDFTRGAVDGIGTYWGAVRKVRADSTQKVWRSSTDWAPLPTPVPCSGKKLLWPLPAEVLEGVVYQWAKAIDAEGLKETNGAG